MADKEDKQHKDTMDDIAGMKRSAGDALREHAANADRKSTGCAVPFFFIIVPGLGAATFAALAALFG